MSEEHQTVNDISRLQAENELLRTALFEIMSLAKEVAARGAPKDWFQLVERIRQTALMALQARR